MKRSASFLTLFLAFYFSVSAQVDSFQQDIISYLNINGTYQQYDEAYDKMYDVLMPQWETAEVPDEVWEDLKKNRHHKIQKLITSLAYAYRNHFTHEEILSMKAFYESETGVQMVKNFNELTEAQTEEVNAFFSSELGEKIEAKREPLSADIEVISRDWSRQLFGDTMKALIKRGYSPKQ